MIILFVCYLLIYDCVRVCLFDTKKQNLPFFLEFSNSNVMQKKNRKFCGFPQLWYKIIWT
jgi:hypothetical protein